jgi:hypothetical protein
MNKIIGLPGKYILTCITPTYKIKKSAVIPMKSGITQSSLFYLIGENKK